MKKTGQDNKRKTAKSHEWQLDYTKARPNRFASQLADRLVVRKAIPPPEMEQFEELLGKARTEAKEAGIKKSDLRSAIAEVRRRRT